MQANATSAVPELDSAAIVFLDELRLQAGNHCEVTFVDLTDEYFFPVEEVCHRLEGGERPGVEFRRRPALRCRLA